MVAGGKELVTSCKGGQGMKNSGVLQLQSSPYLKSTSCHAVTDSAASPAADESNESSAARWCSRLCSICTGDVLHILFCMSRSLKLGPVIMHLIADKKVNQPIMCSCTFGKCSLYISLF